jgi:hypothetical protein
MTMGGSRARCGVRGAGYGVRGAGYGVRVTGYEVRGTGRHRGRFSACWLLVALPSPILGVGRAGHLSLVTSA